MGSKATMTAMQLHIPELDALREEIAALHEKLDALTAKPEWVRVPEAARRLGVSPDTVRRRIASGEIEARGSGKLREVRLV